MLVRSASTGRFRALLTAVALLFFALLLGAVRAQALDFDMKGWWRARYFLIEGVPVDRAPPGTQTEFFDYRLTLEPTLSFSKNLTLKGRLNFLDDVTWGNNGPDASILSGLSRGISNFSQTDELEPTDNIEVERLWMEMLTPVGLLRIGRQPSSWGLGILSNSGGELKWGLEGNGPVTGDTIDRILYLTDLARPLGWQENEHLVFSTMVDRAIENQVAIDKDDVTQFVVAVLSTNGSLTPRLVGSREIGTYVVLLTAPKSDGTAVIADVYGHAEAGNFFLEGEGVFGTGRTRRGGLIPGDKKKEAIDSMIESVAEDFIETTNGSLSMEDALRYARYGFPPFLQGFVSSSLLDTGFSREASLMIAERGVPAGFDFIMTDNVDVEIFGGVARTGIHEGMWTFGLEGAYSSGPGGADDFALPRVGPEGSARTDENQIIQDNIDDVNGKGALLGKQFRQFPFDSEFDPALILYDQAGPLNPATSLPTVTNTRYLKLYVQAQPTEKLTAYALGIWGQLNEPLTLVFDRTDPTLVKFVLDEDNPNEYKVKRRDLGFELDAGVAYRFFDNFKAEIKLGYLFAGNAFGPDPQNIFSLRPQIAILF